MKRNISKNNIGNSGEYYFASILSASNFITTITLGRAEKYDIIAVSPIGKTYKFSIKTRYDKEVKRFPLSIKDEHGNSRDFYYVFIRLNEHKSMPDYWVVPSKIVNDVLKKSSEIYFNKKLKKDGRKHNDVGIRNFWLTLNKTSKDLFPANWEGKLNKYYKNINQIK